MREAFEIEKTTPLVAYLILKSQPRQGCIRHDSEEGFIHIRDRPLVARVQKPSCSVKDILEKIFD